ncbi:ribbon-helix-helix domain-containing protein [Candidatus Poribacteria bacterium]|nr:ribbon-helix-helix domain-containing protein [Candidatus Poribacteria bacterium]
MDSRKVTVSFSLDPSLLKHLDKICQRTKIPRSVLVREGIEEIIKRYETQLKHFNATTAKA